MKKMIVVANGVNTPHFEEIRQWMVEEVARLMLMPYDAIDTDKELEELGLDSQEVLELIGALADWLDRRLPQTLASDYCTIDEIAHHLAEEASYEKTY